jgi:ribosome biogenesis protein NSA2
MFKVISTGKKTHKKGWKRMVTKPTFVGQDFTRKYPYLLPLSYHSSTIRLINYWHTGRPVKYERFIRPMGLRHKTVNLTHPTLGVTIRAPILSVKKNPQNSLYTQLGVLTKGTVVEVNVSELGITTASGKVIWGRWAQITNNPENDGCVNAVLLT